MDIAFDYTNDRVVKARLGRTLTGFIERLLTLGFFILIVGGIALVVFGIAFGWLIIGLAAWPYMTLKWLNGELKNVPLEKRPKSINDVIDTEIAARLPKQPSPADIAAAVGATNSGLFFGARFGATPNFLINVSSSEQSDAPVIWQNAVDVMNENNESRLTAGALVYALIKHLPDHSALLAHNHLELDDFSAGILWQRHLERIIAEHKRRKRTGGIGRDLSFGYTPLLARFGQNVSYGAGAASVDLESHSSALNQLADTFSNQGRQNAVLIGPAGAGKTTVVHAFASYLLDAASNMPDRLKFSQIIMLDSASLISAAPDRGEIEGLIMDIFSEAYSAKNIILCLDDAQLFFEEGIGSIDLSNVLLPIIDAGRLRVILTMDEQRYLQISQRNTALVNALNRINIAPASKEETTLVMQDQILLHEYTRKVTYTYQSLNEAYRLSERYVHDLAMPGRALKLLESSASYAENGLVTMNSVQQAIEQTMNIKVANASDDDEREKLLHLEDLIHERMINQVRAVSAVSDALRRARAGVRNPNRPIGTFMFLGPTGVGKTELAKALAEVYFDGEDNIIRLDMNEFVMNEDVLRLIADGADDPASLTAQAMKRPFSVVLLDEIEKAHPNVLTTLLQLLDEGVLRDVKNREVSFRDTIIIATSNAGADRIREYIERGYKLEQFEDQFVDELINTNQFRPEFLNRFDEIVVFKPLEKPELLQVVDLMIKGVNKTLSAQKISVEVEQDAKELLVDRGYDPRLGARPMRRVIQKVVENNVAKAILANAVQPGSTVIITASQVESTTSRSEQAAAIADASI